MQSFLVVGNSDAPTSSRDAHLRQSKDARRLSVTDDGALVGVSHQGTGDAGTLRVNANSIVLDRAGAITAATTSGEGGNIDLHVRDLLSGAV